MADFRITHPVRFVPMLMILVFNPIFFLYFGKFFAKIIRHTINLRNFASEHIVVIALML